MTIEATCTCGKRFSVAEEHAGKRGKCSKCGTIFVIPQLELTDDDVLPDLNEFSDMADSSLDDLFDESLPHLGEAPIDGVTCPSCHAPMSSGALLCVSCGYHTETGRRLNTVVGAATEPLPPLPKGITVEESGSKLVIKTTGVTESGYYVALIPVLLLVFSGFFAVFLLDSRLLSSAIWSLAFPTLIGTIGYMVAASFLNRRVIEVESSQISIQTEGPLPWPNVVTRVAVDNIVQLYVVETRRRKRVYRRVRNVADAISTAIAVEDAHRTGFDYYTFSVNVVLKNGWRRRLVVLSDRRGAKYIEKKIERFLRVEDIPVVSTWYQCWFLRESTLYDDREDFDPGTAISAKSMPLPAAGMLPGCLLVFLVGFSIISSGLRTVSPRSNRQSSKTHEAVTAEQPPLVVENPKEPSQ